MRRGNDADRWLQKTLDLMDSSPLRRSIGEGKGLPASGSYSEALSAMRTAVSTVLGNLEGQLKIVVMGEVKSGKSTLVNAIVGAEVSPTDFLEATSAIIEISYGDPPGVLTHENGLIEIKSAVPALRGMTLVDTPGMGTITQANQARAEAYIDNADVVLWVLNGNYLGQEDVMQDMASIALRGRPLIALVNKVDQVDGDIGRLMDYAEAMYSPYARAVLPISALQAFEAATGCDGEGMRTSGISALMDFIQNQIMAETDAVKAESSVGAGVAVLEHDVGLHEDFVGEVERIGQAQAAVNDELDAACLFVEDTIHQRLWEQVKSGFLKEECEAWERGILNRGPLLAPSYVKDNITEQAVVEAVSVWWPRAEASLREEYQKLWSDRETDLSRNFGRSLGSIREDVAVGIAERLRELADQGFGTAAPGAGANVPAIPAGDDGWQTPLAIGTGILAGVILGIPLLASALLSGLAVLVSNLMRREPAEDESYNQGMVVVRDIVDQIRTNLWEVVETEFMREVHLSNDRILDELAAAAQRRAFGGWSTPEANALAQNVRGYVQSARALLAIAPSQRSQALEFRAHAACSSDGGAI